MPSKHPGASGRGPARDQPTFYRSLLVVLAIGTAAALWFSFSIGYYKLSLDEIVAALRAPEAFVRQNTVLLRIRLPRILSAYLVGAALSVAGAAYQGMFRNPLVSPDILGAASGAGLGASLAIFFDLGEAATQSLAFALGMAVTFVAYALSRRVRYGQTVSLVLAGTMIGMLCTAATSLLKYLGTPDDTLPAMTFWLMGSLAKADWDSLLFSLPAMILGFMLLFGLRWRLNVLTLDDDEARSVGVHPRRTRIAAIVGATLLCAGAVCTAGLVGWVGLMIPHLVRWMTGPQFTKLLPAAAMAGGIFLVLVDDAARSIAPMEIPLGVLTSFLGAPFFLLLFFRARKESA